MADKKALSCVGVLSGLNIIFNQRQLWKRTTLLQLTGRASDVWNDQKYPRQTPLDWCWNIFVIDWTDNHYIRLFTRPQKLSQLRKNMIGQQD